MEVIWVKWGHEGGALIGEDWCPHKEVTPESPLSPPPSLSSLSLPFQVTAERVSSSRGELPHPNQICRLDLGLAAPKL